jgi:hypothetical protein
MTEQTEMEIVTLEFTSDEADKFEEVIQWARQTPNPKLIDSAFEATTLDGVMDALKDAKAAGLSMGFHVNLRCRNIDDAAYARLRWGYRG